MTTATAVSGDGTPIAYEVTGAGPVVLVVPGANCDRHMFDDLAAELADRCTVVTVDRRGRGENGGSEGLADLADPVAAEVEDLRAVVEAVTPLADERGITGYGHSSGAALLLRAAAAGVPFAHLVPHDAPFMPQDPGMQAHARQYAADLAALVAAGDHDGAQRRFLGFVGMPDEVVDGMAASPMWAGLMSLAPTLPLDAAALGLAEGGTAPRELIGGLTQPMTALVGSVAGPVIDAGTRAVVEAARDARLVVLEGQGHDAAAHVVAPHIAAAATGEDDRPRRQEA